MQYYPTRINDVNYDWLTLVIRSGRYGKRIENIIKKEIWETWGNEKRRQLPLEMYDWKFACFLRDCEAN